MASWRCIWMHTYAATDLACGLSAKNTLASFHLALDMQFCTASVSNSSILFQNHTVLAADFQFIRKELRDCANEQA